MFQWHAVWGGIEMVSEKRLELGRWWVLWVVLYMKKQGFGVFVGLMWLCCPGDVRCSFIDRLLEDRKQVCMLVASCYEVLEEFSQFKVAVFLCGAEAVYTEYISVN